MFSVFETKAQNLRIKSFLRAGISCVVRKLACLNMLRSASARLAIRKTERAGDWKKEKNEIREVEVETA